MRQITKGQEPPSLTAHRQKEHSNFENYRDKEELRTRLVEEQGALCCYCMSRIHASGAGMKIEHWRSQTNFPLEQLIYANLLGGCKGGVSKPFALQHCDTRKGESAIRFNPANPLHHIEDRISYGVDGSIRSSDPTFDGELNTILNLNLPQMKNNRKNVLTALLTWWKGETKRLRGPIPKERIERKIEQHAGSHPNFSPYCQVAVWWLKQKLARMAR